jgi:hypothetical protein
VADVVLKAAKGIRGLKFFSRVADTVIEASSIEGNLGYRMSYAD